MDAKRVKLELIDVSAHVWKSVEEVERDYKEAIKSHPFYDNAHSVVDIYQDGVFRDGKGNIAAIFIKGGLPEYAAVRAANVLRSAAMKTSLRSNIYGGEAPHSGIAGYFDYRGSPVEFKCRKTSFTYEHADRWPDVFPMVDYVSSIYRAAMPENWAKQNAAIPDVVRIHGSPFSTLTINSRFRTASHTDTGDFDDGYGCLACLEGNFKGLSLTLDNFRVNFVMQPRDILLFDTHHFHSNTEPECLDNNWSRLTCVFYYRYLLGEPHSYAEYQRRLAASLKASNRPPPSFRQRIEVKPNGENHNRAATVHPLQLTPFALAGIVQMLSHCAGPAATVHSWLLHEGSKAAWRLFGERLCEHDGLPDRGEDDLQCAHDLNAQLMAPTGGFNASGVMLQAASENQKYLECDKLATLIGAALMEMWVDAKKLWLMEVAGEWTKMTARRAERTDFAWNNHSAMNAAFYDLCEVAKQVMIVFLSKETPTPNEQQTFWALYATHLHTCCVRELKLPEEAMSLRKLNVKLKDFHFGGTRYFKDMPPEEKQRRLERRKRIEEARRCGARVTDRRGNEWLLNDSFDYQTEDGPTTYTEEGRVTPEANAASTVSQFPPTPEPFTGVVEVLVVLPRPQATCEKTTERVHQAPSVRESKDERVRKECARLLDNAASARLQRHGLTNAVLPSDHRTDGVHVRYAFEGDEPPGVVDFVVLQHVLANMEDAAALAYVSQIVDRTQGFVAVQETDLHCRHYYRLQPEIRMAYEEAARPCFQYLHKVRYGVSQVILRTKPQLLGCLPPCAARYKLLGSPLNTTLMLVPGKGHHCKR